MFNPIRCPIVLMLALVGCRQQASMPSGLNSLAKDEAILMEINSVPEPFDIDGNNPYVVWINGKKVDPPTEYIEALVHKVGEENIPKINKKDIHKGWLHPWYVGISQEGQLGERIRIAGER